MKKGPAAPPSRHILVSPQHVQRSVERCTELICFHMLKDMTLVPDGRHEGGLLFNLMRKAAEDKIIIMGIRVLYATNDLGQDFYLYLGGIGCKHVVNFVIPSTSEGVIAEQDRLVYEPNLMNLGTNILPYAGLEHAIKEARSSVCDSINEINTNWVAFASTDPLLLFLLENRTTFDADQHQIRMSTSETPNVYLIHRDLVTRAQFIFNNAIFPLFTYTQERHLTLTWDSLEKVDEEAMRAKDGFCIVTMMLSVDYMVIQPRAPYVPVKELPL
jgi:hypothetical protein